MLRSRGPLAEVQLNCQLRQENGGAKTHAGRGRRPVLRTPNKTQDRPAAGQPAPTVWSGSSTLASAIVTKIPARVSAKGFSGQFICCIFSIIRFTISYHGLSPGIVWRNFSSNDFPGRLRNSSKLVSTQQRNSHMRSAVLAVGGIVLASSKVPQPHLGNLGHKL